MWFMSLKNHVLKIKNLIFEKIILYKQMEDFWKVFGGHILFQGLASAVRFDLFNLLEEKPGLTLAEISEHIKVAPQPCRIMLLSLTASKLIKRSGDCFYN